MRCTSHFLTSAGLEMKTERFQLEDIFIEEEIAKNYIVSSSESIAITEMLIQHQVGQRQLFRYTAVVTTQKSMFQVFTSVLTLLKIVRVESGWLWELVGAKKRIH